MLQSNDFGCTRNNTDFPQIIINSIPAPELVKAKASKRELSYYFSGIRELDAQSPDFILMACNTIHLFRSRLQTISRTPIVDLPREVKEFLLKKRVKKIVVLGTPLTVNSGLFEFSGIETIKPTQSELQQISKAVFLFNNGKQKQKQIVCLQKIALKYSSSAVLLLACTEVSLMLRSLRVKKIDTMDIMVKAALKRLYCKKVKKIWKQKHWQHLGGFKRTF